VTCRGPSPEGGQLLLGSRLIPKSLKDREAVPTSSSQVHDTKVLVAGAFTVPNLRRSPGRSGAQAANGRQPLRVPPHPAVPRASPRAKGTGARTRRGSPGSRSGRVAPGSPSGCAPLAIASAAVRVPQVVPPKRRSDCRSPDRGWWTVCWRGGAVEDIDVASSTEPDRVNCQRPPEQPRPKEEADESTEDPWLPPTGRVRAGWSHIVELGCPFCDPSFFLVHRSSSSHASHTRAVVALVVPHRGQVNP
jgi:hypothetical protein